MAKLSAQLKESEQTPQIISRTQRLQQQQLSEKERAEFEASRQEAQQTTQEFQEKEITEEFKEVIPSTYNVNDQLRSIWFSKTPTQRAREIESIKKYGGANLDTITRTRTRTVPFTLEGGENSYRTIYQRLSPDVRRFFETPETLLQQKAQRIQKTKESVQQKLKTLQQKAKDLRADYERKIKQNDIWFNSKKNKEKFREAYERNRERYKKTLQKGLAKLEGQTQGLRQGATLLSRGKDVALGSIVSFAGKVGSFLRKKQDERAKQKQLQQEQFKKIEDLEARGFKPVVVEKSKGGVQKEVELTFVKDGESVTVGSIGVKSSVDVSGLESAGFTDQVKRSITFGGKVFEYKGRVEIFKDKEGVFVTQFASTGLKEEDLLKQQQDLAIAQRQEELRSKPYVLPFDVIDPKDLPSDYGGQQTASTLPRSILLPSTREKAVGLKDVSLGAITKGVKFLDERIRFDITPSGAIPKLTVSFGKKEEATIPEKIFEGVETGIDIGSRKLSEYSIGKEKITEFETGLQTRYQEQYQTAFDRQYLERITKEEITFEKATEEFEKGDLAQGISQRYSEEYVTGFEELQKGLSGRKLLGGSGQVGLSLAGLGVKAIKTPSRLVITGGLIYGGSAVLKGISGVKGLGTAINVGFAGQGAYKFLDSDRSYIERTGGLIQFGISAGALGYTGYKTLSRGVVKTVKIKAPKIDVKTSGRVAVDVKAVTKKGVVNKVVFPKQKIGQVGVAGRRTIVTTRGRLLSNKYLGTNFKNIYEGVPSAQVGKTYSVKGLRGTYQFSRPSQYDKALRVLEKSGYTTPQAKAVLRYQAPRVIEYGIKKGVLTIKGGKAVGQVTTFQQQRVFSGAGLDKQLGIKTRGARTIETTIKLRRKLGVLKGKDVVLEKSTIVGDTASIELLRKGSLTQLKLKGIDYSESLIRQISSKQSVVRGTKVIDIKTLTETRTLSGQLRLEGTQTKLLPRTLVDTTPVRRFTGARTPFSKTFTDPTLKKVIKQLTKSYSKSVVTKPTTTQTATTRARSQFYGTGQYERSAGGVFPQESVQTNLLKTAPNVPVRITAIKGIIKARDFGAVTGFTGSTVISGALSGLKTDNLLKSSLRTNTLVDNAIKTDVDTGLKTDELTGLKTSSGLKTSLRTLLDTSLVQGTTPSFRSPTIPTTPKITPTKTPVVFPFVLPRGRGTGRGRKKRRSVYDLAYLPDFTSRSLGLAPKQLTQKQAQSQLKRILTGLEIRRGVRLK